MYQQGYTFFNCKHEHKGKQPWKIDKKKAFSFTAHQYANQIL